MLGLSLLAGCSRPPPFSTLSFVTTRPEAMTATVVALGVRGDSCFTVDVVRAVLRPPWRARPADHGAAIAEALASAPGADALLNVQVFSRVEQYLLFQRICSIVTGDAVRMVSSEALP